MLYLDLSGDSVKPWETMELPPEVCILHVGLKGKLCRGGPGSIDIGGM